MKRKFKYGFMAMMLGMAMLSCNNSGRYYESTDTGAAIEESMADNSAADDSAAAEEKLAELGSMPELQNYKGLYKVTDENGIHFNIYFTKDDSAIITDSSGNIYYCSFSNHTLNGKEETWINPSENDIRIQFKGGAPQIRSYITLVLKDNWLYGETKYADSNNPNWRLPVTVVKAFGGKKSEYSSSSYKSSESSSYSKNRNSGKASDYDDSEEIDPRDEELAMRAASIYKDPTDAVYDNLRRKYRND